jgi:hypothetical protein
VLRSEIDTESITPIYYRDLSTGEQQLVESATDREKCIHPNRRPEIGLLKDRLKHHTNDGAVYLVWDDFYYRMYYTNGDREVAG